jgi:predicted RNA binding protein YcfA (HicA-like mRNA interferase family)
MTKVPSIGYGKVIKALQRDGWVVVRQKGSHIRLQKHERDEVMKLTVPAHRPIKRSTLSHILKQARLSVEKFIELM